MSNRWRKDPEDVLNYVFDFAPLENDREDGESNWLDRTSSPVESISSHSIIVDSVESPYTLTVDADSITDNNTSVTVKLSGGTAGVKYKVTCRIVTSETQTKDKTAYVTVAHQ